MNEHLEELVMMYGEEAETMMLADGLDKAFVGVAIPFGEKIRAVYDMLKGSGELSLGLDDFLMAMADAHDTNRYLLRQRTAGTGSAARRPVATRRTAEPPRDLSVRAFSLRHRGSR